MYFSRRSGHGCGTLVHSPFDVRRNPILGRSAYPLSCKSRSNLDLFNFSLFLQSIHSSVVTSCIVETIRSVCVIHSWSSCYPIFGQLNSPPLAVFSLLRVFAKHTERAKSLKKVKKRGQSSHGQDGMHDMCGGRFFICM